jgi:hypothetical protein
MCSVIKHTSYILRNIHVKIISPFNVELMYIIYGAFPIYRFLRFSLNLIVDAVCLLLGNSPAPEDMWADPHHVNQFSRKIPYQLAVSVVYLYYCEISGFGKVQSRK